MFFDDVIWNAIFGLKSVVKNWNKKQIGKGTSRGYIHLTCVYKWWSGGSVAGHNFIMNYVLMTFYLKRLATLYVGGQAEVSKQSQRL